MKWHFIGVVMAITGIVLLVQLLPLASYLQQVERDRLTTSLERDAFILAGRSEEALESGVGADALGEAAHEYRETSGARVVVVDRDGRAIVTSDDDQSSLGGDYSTRPEIADALGGSVATGSRDSETLSTSLLYVAVPVISADSVVGAVRLTYPSAVIDETVRGRLGVIGSVALITLLISGLAAFVFSASVTRRLTALTASSERLADGDLSARADPMLGAPEIRTLARSFNRMAERVSTLIEQQRSFASDASHQLRTPLTALRLRLERARELMANDPEAAADRIAAAEAETDRLVAIVEGLLALGRAERRDDLVITVDLAAIARDHVEQWRPLCAELGVDLRVAVPAQPAIPVRAIPGAVEQIVDNLVDNALEVSPPGSTLEVRVDGGANPTLRVRDDGPGLSDDEIARAFDRFWRGRSATPGGTGLGLAIVQELASSSGARVRLGRRAERGLDATVEFRRAQP
ncbi:MULTISPECIES: ATP-binding protein [unclassified Microcella]|uniref:sensor histidine kinase n=1 Tax=unclassified Microcella TaxID=2630066 RepID=UPI0006FCCC00|nr:MULTISPECIES: ATP-binding protein [unclassified Microcella]KQV25919.1 histidine kinase [Yonghaparkia sp. Root332]KRF33273.1 histidine kinase [Yonghaparkia sp. Soil809]